MIENVWVEGAIWVCFFMAGFGLGGLLGGIWLYNKGVRDGAQDYLMIIKYLEDVYHKRELEDRGLGEIENVADAIRKGSE